MEHFHTPRAEFDSLRHAAERRIATAEREHRDLSPDEKSENERAFVRMRMINEGEQYMLGQARKAFSSAMDSGARSGAVDTPFGTVTFPSDAPGREEYERSLQGHQFAALPGEAPEATENRFHRQAVNEFLRTGRNPSAQFTVITTSGGGVLVPSKTARPITIKRAPNPFRAVLMARGLIPIITTDMSAVNAPVFDDSANMADAIAENATGDNPKDPALTSLAVAAPLLDSGTIWFSNSLLSSFAFDLLAYLEPTLEARVGAKELSVWSAALLASVVTGKTTASTTGVTYSELLDWQHSIAVHLRGDGVFVLNDTLFRAIRGLVDTTGHPIFQESLRDDAPDTLLGWPIIATTALQAPAANAVSGIAVSAGSIVVRDVTGAAGGRRIARYSNQPGWPDQVGIRMFSNSGFAFVSSGVRALKHAAA